MGLRSAHAACLVAAVLCFRPARSNGDVAAEEDMMLAGAGYDTSDMPNVLTKVDCVYTDPLTQKRWDLTDMEKDTSAGWIVPAAKGAKSFYTNFCSVLTIPCRGSKQKGPANTLQFENGKCIAKLGTLNNPIWSPLETMNPDAGVKVTFDGGDNCGGKQRKTTIVVKCDRTMSEAKPLVATEPTICEYTLQFQGPEGCPSTASLSGGWSLIIVGMVLTASYCGCGALYKSKYMGAQGMDAIPNHMFWNELPGLVRDGCEFSHMQVQKFLQKGGSMGGGGGGARRRGEYDNI